MGYCPATSRWLIVRRKTTPAYTHIVIGSCRNVHYVELVPQLTSGEAKTLMSLPSDSILSEIHASMGIKDPEVKAYSKSRLESKFLQSILSENEGKQSRTQKWGWPGGGIKKGEIPVLCAVREMEEETGIEPSDTYQIIYGDQPPSIVNSFRSYKGHTYKSSYWVVIFRVETILKTVSHLQDEIAESRWVKTSEIEEYIGTENMTSFRLAHEIARIFDEHPMKGI